MLTITQCEISKVAVGMRKGWKHRGGDEKTPNYTRLLPTKNWFWNRWETQSDRLMSSLTTARSSPFFSLTLHISPCFLRGEFTTIFCDPLLLPLSRPTSSGLRFGTVLKFTLEEDLVLSLALRLFDT